MESDVALPSVPHPGARPLVRAGWAAVVVVTSAVTLFVVLSHPSGSGVRLLDVVWAVAWIASGALVLLRGTSTRISVLVGCMLLANGMTTPVSQAVTGTSSALVGRVLVGVALTLSVLTLSVFPDGRFVPGWLKWVCAGFAGWQVVAVVGTTGVLLDVVGGVVYFVGIGVPVIAQVWRFRELDPAQRVRTKWVVYGVCAFLAVDLTVSLPYFAPGWFPDLVAQGSTYDQVQNAVSTVALLLVPLCITIAMLASNLFDVDVVISRTLVYAVLSAAVAVGYLGVVGVFGLLVGRQDTRLAPLVAAAVIAVLFGPLRSWLQAKVRRLVYGLRAEPYAALTTLGRQLAVSSNEDDVPQRLVATIRQSLRAPYVAVAVADATGFPVAAESGLATTQRLALPLRHGGEDVGMLLIGYDDRHPLSPADRTLLADLARQAGAAIHALQLTANIRRGAEQLQLVREQLVLAREDARRRLRRDLHDGLAPTLAAAGLIAATAADLADRDPRRTGQLLSQLQGSLTSAIDDIRAMVDELRPPALDELGLLPALRERASDLAHAVAVDVSGPDEMPPLPAAVEVAAFRISQEALMNVLKHSGATHASITIALEDRHGLSLVVEDDGAGLGHQNPAGVGLASMRERAAELGGWCTVDMPPAGGTRVSAWFPLHDSSVGPA